jgi:hypothetical protein
MGVQEMTRFGMEEKDFDTLAGYIADVIIHNRNVEKEVSSFRKNFLEMKYCLPLKEAIPLAVRIMCSLLPSSDYINQFAENLIKIAKN